MVLESLLCHTKPPINITTVVILNTFYAEHGGSGEDEQALLT